MRKNVIAGVFFVLIAGGLIFATFKPEIDNVKSVSEWEGVFDVTCSCGNTIHVEPYDPECFKIVCAGCGRVYEKNWTAWQRKIDKWEYR